MQSFSSFEFCSINQQVPLDSLQIRGCARRSNVHHPLHIGYLLLDAASKIPYLSPFDTAPPRRNLLQVGQQGDVCALPNKQNMTLFPCERFKEPNGSPKSPACRSQSKLPLTLQLRQDAILPPRLHGSFFVVLQHQLFGRPKTKSPKKSSV